MGREERGRGGPVLMQSGGERKLQNPCHVLSVNTAVDPSAVVDPRFLLTELGQQALP